MMLDVVHHSIVSVQFTMYFLSWLDQSYSVIPDIVMTRKNPFILFIFRRLFEDDIYIETEFLLIAQPYWK